MQSRPPSPTTTRRIRSYVLRTGRITDAQRAALEALWPRYGLDPAVALDTRALFGTDRPMVLDIGFGNGEALAALAHSHPQRIYLGIEVHRPGVGQLLMRLEAEGIDNVRVYCADAVEVLERCIAPASLQGVQLYFPDPWPKKRHHKRRLVNPEFAALVASRLTAGGFFHAATDWEDYARQMLQVLDACPRLRNRAGPGRYPDWDTGRPHSKFERRGLRLGHGVWDLLYEKT